jgi:hypothetical protein
MFEALVVLLVLMLGAGVLAPTRRWLQQHGWWALLAIAVISIASGVIDLVIGITWQASDVTGRTLAQIAAESEAASQLAGSGVRTGGSYLIAFGAILVISAPRFLRAAGSAPEGSRGASPRGKVGIEDA